MHFLARMGMIAKNRRIGRMKFGPVVVTVVIFLLCAGVGIPGIQNLRQSTRKIQCMTNIKQVNFGVLNFESSNNHFPFAAISNESISPDKRLSWLFDIGPYLV